jgi:diguanylate cyclase (GGDEF)-like protein
MGGETEARSFDDDVRSRRDQILAEMSAMETPRVGVIFTILIALFDVVSAVSGTVEPWPYYLSDVVQGTGFILAAWLVWSRRVTTARAPAVFAAALVLSNVALNLQYAIDPAANVLGIIMISLSASGALILMWRPFLVATAIMATVTTLALVTSPTANAEGWIITMLLAIGVSAVLLFGRSRSATTMAMASLTIEEIATRDPLTGLLNRRGLQLSSGTVASLAFRNHEPLFAVFVDIVGLKKVNDSFGHTIGDLVIQRVGRAVESISRGADLVTRWGGDEFLVVGIGPQPDEDEYLERIRGSLDMTGLEDKWPGLISLGAAYDDSCDVDALIGAADAAMYDARAIAHLRED